MPTDADYELLRTCPAFDGHRRGTDAILEWAEKHFDASVYWSNKVYGEQGVKEGDEYAQWSLGWKFGGMMLDFTPKPVDTDEQKINARRCAALFIYLYSKRVEVSIASRCADCYVSGTGETRSI